MLQQPTGLGYIGDRMDLVVAQGRSFGPMTCIAEVINPALLPWPVDTPLPESAWVPLDLTGSVIRGQIRRRASDATAVANLDVQITDAIAGKYQISMTDEVSATLRAGATLTDSASLYHWDLELATPAGEVIPLYYGDLRVLRRITRV